MLNASDSMWNQDRPAWGRGVLASYVAVSHGPVAIERSDDGSISVTRLSVPIQIVGILMLGFLSALGSFYALSGGLRSGQDQMVGQQKTILAVIEGQQRLADERQKNIEAALSQLRMEQRMLQEYNTKLYAAVAAMSGGRLVLDPPLGVK